MINRKKFTFIQQKRSILRNITHVKKDNVIQAGIGDDYGRLIFSRKDVAVAEGLCLENSLGYVKTDIIKIYNNLRAGGYIPFAMTDTIMMPCDDEKQMKTILKEIQHMADELHIDIISGHTEVSEVFSKPAVTITMLGQKKIVDNSCEKRIDNKDLHNRNKKVSAGMDIVMCGHAGIMGTVISVHENYDKLLTRYSEDYLRTAIRCESLIKLENQADIMLAYGALYTHDISTGGVYGALWELAEKYNLGIDISHDAIPILQETIEICEFIGENPYMVDGSGGILCIIEAGEQLVEELYSQGYEASIIGRTTTEKARTITHDEEQRYLGSR